jgi:hypothetical protein
MTWNELSNALSFGGSRKKKAQPKKVADEKPRPKPTREEILKDPMNYGIHDFNKELLTACGVNWGDFLRFVNEAHQKLIDSGREVSRTEVRHMIIAQYLLDTWGGQGGPMSDIFKVVIE